MGRKPEYTEKSFEGDLKAMPCSRARKFKTQTRLEHALKHRRQTGEADVLTFKPHVKPFATKTTMLSCQILLRRCRSPACGECLCCDEVVKKFEKRFVCLFCWSLNVPATCYSVSQGRICSGRCTWFHTRIEFADQTFYFNQSQYTDTGPTSPRADPITPGTW